MRPEEPFQLYGLKPAFQVDLAAVEARHQKMMLQVHPDRFADKSPAERRVAEQWSARFNEALRLLKDPVSRATLLCELADHPVRAETDTHMDPAFLIEQMERREALEQAQAAADHAALARLEDEAARRWDALVADLAEAIDARADYEAAVELVRRLMFERKYMDELEQ